MDFPIFEEDSYFNEINRSAYWCKDSISIDLIQLEISDDKTDSIHHKKNPLCKTQDHESLGNHQHSTETSFPLVSQENQENSEVLNSSNVNDSKSKKIYKPEKHDQNVISQKSNIFVKIQYAKSSSNRTKSKYNNMGGFLIGTFSEILNSQKSYRFNNGWLEAQVKGKWINLEQVDFFEAYQVKRCLTLLKEKIYNLPRKDGAKKHLFQLINSETSDSEEIKKSKSILRKELIDSLDQEYWLFEHVQSRDFKPQNDDFFGTKKKQRHSAYMEYLRAIKLALQTKECIPKRICMS